MVIELMLSMHSDALLLDYSGESQLTSNGIG